MTGANRSVSSPPLTVGFVSLGCAKNLVDSQIMAGSLLDQGLTLAPRPEAADVVIVNTCAFIEEARRESVDGILSACRLKETGPVRAVLVAGCLPQRYKEELAESLPEVDAFIGLDQLDEVGAIVRNLAAGKRGMYRVSCRATRLFAPGAHQVVFSGGPFAYLKIAEGCNHACAFCAIPRIRGAYRSRPVADLAAEAGRLLDAGYRELNLISQDTTWYGRDRKNGANLSGLLRALAEEAAKRRTSSFWLRIIYGHPRGIDSELLRTMRDLPQVCRYLDVPIQHSHPDMLRAMRRAGTVDAVRRIADRVREALPGAALRTTCLVGFPGETNAHFEHLLRFVRAVGFDHLGVFAFSPEEGTPAYNLPDRPSRKVAAQRQRLLLSAQREMVDARARSLVGAETVALIEHPIPDSPGAWSARSYRQAPEVDGRIVVHDAPAGTHSGDFVRVRYTAQADYDMRAVVTDP